MPQFQAQRGGDIHITLNTEPKKKAPPKKRRKKRASAPVIKKPYTYTPPQLPAPALPPYSASANPVQNSAMEARQIQRMWAKLSELERQNVRDKRDAKFGKSVGLVNPKGKMLQDSARGRTEVVKELSSSSDKTQSLGSDVRSRQAEERAERRKQVIAERNLRKKIRDSNQVDNNLKEQEKDPVPKPRGMMRRMADKVRERVSRPTLTSPRSRSKIEPVPAIEGAKIAGMLRSPDYYEGRKTGAKEQRKEMRGQLRSFHTKAMSSATNRSQAGIREGLTPIYNSLREQGESSSDEPLTISGRGRKVGWRGKYAKTEPVALAEPVELTPPEGKESEEEFDIPSGKPSHLPVSFV